MSFPFELGGFAESPEIVSESSNEEEQLRDYEAFNYCLAEEYVCAMIQEDFESLGEMDGSLLNKICYWINYKESLGNKELAEQVANGTITTNNDRTFIEAIVANKSYTCADMYLENQIYDPALIHLMMEKYAEKEDEYYYCYIFGVNQETFDNINDALYSEIEKNYQEATDKIAYLNMIKKGIGAIRYRKGLEQRRIKITQYTWAQALKKINKGKE